MTTTTFDDEMVTIFKDVLGMEITNDVAVALIGHGYTTWKLFRHMWLSDVDELKKSDGKGGMVLCMLAHRQKIERFIQDRENKRQENDPNFPWKDITSYTEDEFDDFGAHVSSNKTILPTTRNKSAVEKALETWIHCKRQNSGFNVPKVDTAIYFPCYFPTAVTDDECQKVHNNAVDTADKTTADPVESTHLVSNATTTENATSVVENGLTIDTSRCGPPTPTGRSTTTKYRKT